MSEDDTTGERDYQIQTIRDFDPNSRGISPELDPSEAMEFAADHSGLPDETWELVDADTGEVIHSYDV